MIQKLLLLVNIASALSTWYESCDKISSIDTKADFDEDQYVGKWYQQKADFFWAGQCTTATYTAEGDGTFEVENTGWFWWFASSYYTLRGLGTCGTDGKCWVTFNLWGSAPDKTSQSNYLILDTDYTNYSIVYTCSESWYGNRSESAWILTRDSVISDSTYKEYEAKLKTLKPGFS